MVGFRKARSALDGVVGELAVQALKDLLCLRRVSNRFGADGTLSRVRNITVNLRYNASLCIILYCSLYFICVAERVLTN